MIKKEKGFSMLEVLVAMVIIAIGLMGNAAVILKTKKLNSNAYMHSQAVLLANDMVERLRVNRAHALSGDFAHAIGAGSSADATIVGAEVNDWLQRVSDSLLEGDGSVSVNSTGQVTIVIQWKEVLKSTGGGINSFTTEAYI